MKMGAFKSPNGIRKGGAPKGNPGLQPTGNPMGGASMGFAKGGPAKKKKKSKK